MAGTRAHPAFGRHHHRHRLVHHLDLGHGLLLGLDQRAALIAKGLGVGLDLFDHQAAQAGRVGQNVFQLALLLAQLFEFLLDLDRLQPRQLAQADFQNVLGLPVAQIEARDQRGLGLVAGADDGNHFVNIEQHDLPPFENVNAVQHLVQPVLRTAGDGRLAEGNPLLQHLPQALGHGLAVQAHHGQVDGGRRFQAGVGQQRGDQFLLLDAAALRLEHQAHRRFFAGLVAHPIEHRQQAGLELRLLLRQRLLAGLDLGVGDVFDFLQHLLRADAGRKLGHHQLPLAAGQVFDLPARAHLQATAPGTVGVVDVGRRADDLAATGVVWPGQQGQQVVVGQLRVFDQRHTGVGHFAQVVAGDLGSHAHGNTAGAVEQHERQPGRQLARFLGGAVVIGHPVHRALIDLVQQQGADAAQAGFGVAHGGGTVAVAAAEVALPVDEWIALREVLRHAHQRVVGGLVAVGVEAPEHIPHHAGAFDRLGRRVGVRAAIAQTHALHRVQDAPLHGLLAVAHIGQRPALDDAQRIFQIGPLRVGGQAVGVIGASACEGGIGRRQGFETHALLSMSTGSAAAQRIRTVRTRPCARLARCPAGTRWPSGGQTRRRSPRPASR